MWRTAFGSEKLFKESQRTSDCDLLKVSLQTTQQSDGYLKASSEACSVLERSFRWAGPVHPSARGMLCGRSQQQLLVWTGCPPALRY